MSALTTRAVLATAMAVSCGPSEDDPLPQAPFDEEQLARELTPEVYLQAHERLRRDTLEECGCNYDPRDIEYLELDGALAAVDNGALRFDSECAARILASHNDLVCEAPAPENCWTFKADKQEGEPCTWPAVWFSECDDDMLCMAVDDSDTGVCRKWVEAGGACAEGGSTGACRVGSCIDGICIEGTVGLGGTCDDEERCATGLLCDTSAAEPGTCRADRCDLVHEL